MKTTINITYSYKGGGLKGFIKDLRTLRGELKRIEGRYIFYVDSPGGESLATQPMIIDEALLTRAVEPALRLKPSALAPYIANGGLLPDKKRTLIANLQREQARQMKQATKGGKAVIRNREQYLAMYAGKFDYFSGRIGRPINAAIDRGL